MNGVIKMKLSGAGEQSFHDLSPWLHAHHFTGTENLGQQRRTEWVIGLTLVTMILELWFGYSTGSMALVADGWHMGSHVAALSITVIAYRYARQQAGNSRFTFGTGKVGALGGYTSAVFLACIAFLMLWQSGERLWNPREIAYQEALLVASIGMVVNLVSVWLLRDGQHHDHHHSHDHPKQHHHHDHNLRGAFLHVLADLLTSVLAILALVGGWYFGWSALDPLMGVVGAVLILYWARGLIISAGRVLLDAEEYDGLRQKIITAIESLGDHKIVDLHVWSVGTSSQACIVSILSHQPRPVGAYKELLALIPGLHHITVEVNQCYCSTPLYSGTANPLG